jgi:branched-chain amino acid transport system substrate-binding protein
MSPATTPPPSSGRREFGLVVQGMKIVPMSFQSIDIHAVGVKATRGDLILTSFFEDASPAARRFSSAFYVSAT